MIKSTKKKYWDQDKIGHAYTTSGKTDLKQTLVRRDRKVCFMTLQSETYMHRTLSHKISQNLAIGFQGTDQKSLSNST